MSERSQASNPFSRRDFLARSAMTAAAIPSLGALLAACARDSGGSATPSASATGLQLASPENPVKWPIAADNAPIAAGLKPEQGATLRLYNYPDYIDPAALKSFEKKYESSGVKIEVSTFNDTNESLAKIRGGSVPFDVYFPSYDQLGKLVAGGLVQPLSQSYIPNIDSVWDEFKNPFYDQGWQFTVPYVVYTTGIGWRTDKIKEDIGALANPYDALWDTKYTGRTLVLDDYREVQAMTLLRSGNFNTNESDPAVMAKVLEELLKMSQTVRPKVAITNYTDLPEGRVDLVQAWSGDMVLAQSYMPEGEDPSVLRYWFPKDGKGAINNDTMVILRGSKNPVLAHLFLNHMLDYDTAFANYAFTGYQPPQKKITPENLVADKFLPPGLAAATVLPSSFTKGSRQLELAPDVEAIWQANWQQFKAGG